MAKKRPRTERRERERALDKLARDREKLARLELGGSAERPIELESASQVEPHARSLRCTRCEVILPRSRGQRDYAAWSRTNLFNSNSTGLT